MNRYEEFFLENQWDLDAEAPRPFPARLLHECEHRWDRVIVTTRALNPFEPGFSCSRCGAERYDEPFDHQDLDTLHAERHGERKAQSRPKRQCCATTTKGRQCDHPCLQGRNMCQRHLKLSRAFAVECHLCAAMIAPGERYEPKFETLWGDMVESSRLIRDFRRVMYVIESDEPFCSSECCLAFTETLLVDAHP